MKKIAAIFFWIFFYVAVSFSCSTIAFAVEIMCHQPKENFVALPLSFSSVPTIPAQLTIGAASEFVYTVQNNTTSLSMEIMPSLPGAGGEASIITSTSNDCSLGDLTPSDTCNITVEIEPTILGPASYALAVNYIVDEEGSCFNDITSNIEYEAISSGGDTYAYITNQGGNSVTVCVNQGASGLGSCVDSGVNTFMAPGSIAIPVTSFSGNYYAYVTNVAANTVFQCSIDTNDGTFSGCTDSGLGAIFSAPTGLSIQPTLAGGTLYAYAVNSGMLTNEVGTITQCTLNASTGAFSSCGDAAPPFASPQGVAFQAAEGGAQYMYVANNVANGVISKCGIATEFEGVLGLCFSAAPGESFFNRPANLEIFTVTDGTFAYVTDSDFPPQGTVQQCEVDVTTGNFTECVNTGSDYDIPVGIIFEEIASTQYAFVTNTGNNTISTCTVDDTDGSFDCVLNLLDFADVVTGVETLTIAGVNYTYVTDISTGKVLQCKIYDGEADGQLYCIDSGASIFNNPISIKFHTIDTDVYAYIADVGAHTVWLCEVNATTAQLDNCDVAGPTGLGSPYDLTFATVNNTDYAYISDVAYHAVWQCEVDIDGSITGTVGALCNCVDAAINIGSPAGTPPYLAPVGMAFQTVADIDYVYVTDAVQNLIFQCALDPVTGLFMGDDRGCPDAGVSSSLLNVPGLLTFQAVGDTTYAYIPNLGFIPGTLSFSADNLARAADLTQCTLNTSSGALESCQQNTFSTGQAGIAFESVSESLYAYVSVGDGSTGEIQKCVVNTSGGGNNGNLSLCALPFGAPVSIGFQVVGSDTKAYIVEKGGSGILLCDVSDIDASISNCVDAGTTFNFTSPNSLTFQEFSGTTYAYITDITLNTVTQCTWDSSTGYLSSCADSGGGNIFNAPSDLLFYFNANNSQQYVYVSNASGNIMTQCEVDASGTASNGNFSNCKEMGSFFGTPLDMAFIEMADVNYAYVTDQLTQGVTVCVQDSSTGLLTDCQDSGAERGAFNQPGGVEVFVDDDGEVHLYVTNATANTGTYPLANTVTFCLADPLTGLLSACGDSGAGAVFSSPAGIAFQPFSGTTYVYIDNADMVSPQMNTVSQCAVNADGTFDVSSCMDTGATSLTIPFGITFFTPP